VLPRVPAVTESRDAGCAVTKVPDRPFEASELDVALSDRHVDHRSVNQFPILALGISLIGCLEVTGPALPTTGTTESTAGGSTGFPLSGTGGSTTGGSTIGGGGSTTGGGCNADTCGWTCCGDLCVALDLDSLNCGACGHVCPPSEVCYLPDYSAIPKCGYPYYYCPSDVCCGGTCTKGQACCSSDFSDASCLDLDAGACFTSHL